MDGYKRDRTATTEAVSPVIATILLLAITVLLTGAVFFLNLVIIGMPLLIAFVLFRSLVGHFRRDEPDTFIVQTLPPDSS